MSQSQHSRTTTIASIILILALLVVFGVWYTQHTAPEQGVSTGPSFLYVQTAHSGTLSGEKSDGTRTLTLNDVSPVTVYFSERPDRETGHQSTADFIAQWDAGEDNFGDNPPNAALDIIGADSQSIAIVELMSATYNSATQHLEYEVVILDDETEGTIPQSFDEVALFIDSTFTKYHCGCELEAGKKDCVCSYNYHLKRSQTKEFRGYCTASKLEPAKMSISGKNKGTTCTTDILLSTYNTRSCTNWSLTSGDDITVKVHCSKEIPL